MSTRSEGGGKGVGVLAMIGVVLLPLACCGVPLLFGAGALGAAGVLGAVGGVLGNPWVIAAAVVIAAALVVWVLRRQHSKTAQAACCVPEKLVSKEPVAEREAAEPLKGHHR